MALELAIAIEKEMSFQDIAARHGVEINIREDGLVIWLNVDGICRARIITNGLTTPIKVKDDRKNDDAGSVN